jgi:hypothetical protein
MGGTCQTMNGYNSQTCIKRLHLGQRKCGILRQVTPIKRFSSCEIIYDRTKKCDILIQMTA